MPKDIDRLKKILAVLRKTYPEADCALDHKTPFQLLIATILSAQCTDQRVNLVTPVLFKKYPAAEDLAKAPLEDVESIIRSTGFYHSKALSLVTTSRLLVETFGGEVPRVMKDLLTLRGVARKTANVVLGTSYGIAEGVVVDTHVTRLSNRLGFTRQKDPVKIERDLMAIVPKEDWIWISHAFITHGRQVCKAINPQCPACPLEKLCPKRGV
jgi:endonuclease III